MCGGAMLTMITNTVLPEAFEQGGDVIGLSCLAGFMAAIAVRSTGMLFDEAHGTANATNCSGLTGDH